MLRFYILSCLLALLAVVNSPSYAQGVASGQYNPEHLLDFTKFLALDNGEDISRMPQFDQISLKPCQAGAVSTEFAQLVIPKDALPNANTITLEFYLHSNTNATLPEDILNITISGGFARMSPSTIRHEGQLEISLKIAEDQLPAWAKPHDIVGLAYSGQSGSWSQTTLYRWDEQKQIATFLTDPFAEFIAGIIQAPELSPTAAFTNTDIKDYKTPPPHAGINFIKPPTPNSMGSANLNYPIEIPEGRAGMQPNLNLTYNSDGGNGWMGLGWDLSVPSITIDTRWGVPLYDAELETETYTFQGQMLYPVAHRGERVNREANRVFHPRIEGEFAQIIRHGDRPNNYRWEVIEKSGRRSYYGGRPEGISDNAVLKATNGNIAQWLLLEERDPNGNTIRYTYSYETDNGPNGNHSTGYNRYLSTINYTARDNEPGKYTVLFIRDQQMDNYERRNDAFSNGVFGFKRVTASLLERIEIVMNGDDLVRAYELEYRSGIFDKTILNAIIHRDAENKVFNEYTFDYYDDTNNDGGEFAPVREYNTAQYSSDGLNGGLLSNDVLGFPDKTSFLGGNKAGNFSAGIAVTVGRVGSSTCKRGTIGGHYIFSKTQGSGLNAFIDINGDNLPDKVFVKNGRILFRPCLGLLGNEVAYGDAQQIIIEDRVNNISRSKTKGHTFGPEATFGGSYISYSTSKSKTTESVYFQDFNADGLVDMAFFGKVYFNRTVDGQQVFLPTSEGTINPIPSEGNVPISDEITSGFDEPDFAQQNPLHDAVRLWVAPYDGTVRITSQIKLLSEDSDDYTSYNLKDGVYVRIEHNHIGSNTTPSLVFDNFIDTLQTDEVIATDSVIDVKKGDYIFFRVNSRYDGAFDQVAWVANIDYLDSMNMPKELLDANKKNPYQYSSSRDFLLSAPQEFGMPLTGDINIRNTFNIPPLSDSIHLKIKKKFLVGQEPDLEEEIVTIWGISIPPHTAHINTIELPFGVDEQDLLSFEVSSTSNVDWQAIEWQPYIEYLNYMDSTGNAVSLLDADGNSQIAITGTVEKKVFSIPKHEQPNFLTTSPGDSSIRVEARYVFTLGPPLESGVPFAPAGAISITVKSKDSLYYSRQIETPIISNIGSTTPVINLCDNTFQDDFNGDTLYVDIHFSSNELSDFFSSANKIMRFDGNNFEPNIFTIPNDNMRIFGNLHNGWGQFTYKVDDNQPIEPISRDTINSFIEEYENQDLSTNNMPDDPNDFDGTYPDPTKRRIGLFYADAASNAWMGYDPLLFVTDSIMSSSRLGEDNEQFASSTGAGGGLSAPIKLNKTESKSLSGKIPLTSFTAGISDLIPENTFDIGDTFDDLDLNGSFSGSWTESWQSVDLIDFNLNGYPDILGGGKIQYTSHLGQRTNTIHPHDSSFNTHKSKSNKWGVTSGAKTSQATVTNTFAKSGGGLGINSSTMSQSGSVGVLGGASASANFSLTANASASLSGSVDHNLDRTVSSWIDVNGDGLVDAIKENGQVRLNLGYRFSSLEDWGDSVDIRIGASKTTAASASLSGFLKCHGSWSFGIGLSKVENHSLFGHQDVNGDGMPDILTTDKDNNLYAQINLGQKYTTPIRWVDDFKLDEGLSVNESVNGSFTICINIGIFFRICFNPKGDAGRNVSMPKSRIADINGDGFPDFLKSSSDDNLTYALSKIGRTNKLKTVRGPLGAEMTLDYEVIPSSYQNPSPQWVLSSVETDDGYEGDGPSIQKSAFEYAAGYKDRREREFYGFARVVSHSLDTEADDAIYRTTIQHYANSTYYNKGLLLADTMMDASDNLYSTTAYHYELRNPLATSVQVLSDTYSDDDGLAWPALRNTRKSYYEGQTEAGVEHITRYEYDLKGNTTLYIDEGSGLPEDEVQAVISYHSLPSLGIFNIPRDLRVIDHEGAVLRHRSCEVYPENGNIKSIRQFYTPSNAAAFDYEYDGYGNITKVTRPANLHGQRMTYSFSYDDEVHTYVVETKDTYGYSSSALYDYRFGVLLETTDLNGNKMQYAYDAKGRLSELTGPYELAAGKSYTIKMEYYPDADTPYSICRHYNEDTDSDILTITFVDGLGRAIQVKKSGLLFQSPGQADQEVLNVSGKTVYDAFGREIEAYYPVSEPMSNMTVVNVTADTETPTRTTYDVLDRELVTTLPDGSATIMAYDFSEPPTGGALAFYTVTTDALGNRTEVYNDIRGRNLAATAYGPDGPITTSFSYNAISEMVAVTDAAGNTTTFTHDMLGRQTSIDHPVSGLTEVFYDPLGQVTRKLTANIRDAVGEESGILYDYDFERPTTITYPLNYQNKVEFVYGDSSATNNRRGKVVLQRDASGAQEFFYGPMGEITKTIRTVVINPVEVRTYVSEARYDSWNRVQQLFYPDSEVVDYNYNSAGKLTSLTGKRFGESYAYVNRISYNKFEKRRYIQLGNGAEQEYTYDPKRQWLDKMSARTNNTPFMDMGYTYDAVANILSVSNTVEPVAGEIGGAYTHNYGYDELYRLDYADGTWTRGNREETYTFNMDFDNTHNILSKEQERMRNGQLIFNEANYLHTYQYDSGRPFVPSKVGRFHYDYDLNGNLLSVTDTTALNLKEYEWDEENRLTAVIDNGYMSRYTYDAFGERVVKSHGPITGQAFNGSDNGFIDHRSNYTAYISPNFVTRQGTYTKHYFIEGQRICSKVGQGVFNNNSAGQGQGTLTAGNIDYTTWLQQVRANELAYYGDSLAVSHPTMPFRYVVPDSTGEAYPDLLPDSIEVTTTSGSFYVLPNRPDLSGNSQATHPVWELRDSISTDSIYAGYGMVDTVALPYEALQYFYHSDHVSSTAYITDRNGRITQFAVYTAFGELFLEDQLLNINDSQSYLFNGKKLDRETGLYYYGARYYEPVSSMWMSVDPLANKYPGWSPYNYTMLNPVRLVDPDGREGQDPNAEKMYDVQQANTGNELLTNLAKYYLTPTEGQWRARFSTLKKGMNRAGQIARNLMPKLRTAGNQNLESKASVVNRSNSWGRMNKSFGVFGVTLASATAYSEYRNGNQDKVIMSSLDAIVGTVGLIGNPVASAFSIGWSIGRFSDRATEDFTGTSLSDRAGNWMFNTFGPLQKDLPQKKHYSPLPDPSLPKPMRGHTPY